MRLNFLALVLVAAALAVAGCDSTSSPVPMAKPSSGSGTKSDGSGTRSESNLRGTITIDGSSTVQPIANAIREEFVKVHPGVEITVGGNGTGNGFKSFYDKGSDISDASRPIKFGEFENCLANGVNFIELPVAYDGLTIAVHPDNDWAKELTVDELKKMFVGEDAAQKWSDVDASWPEEKIEFYAPGTGSGTYDYFYEVLAKEDEKELRDDMSLNEDDNILVQGVAGNKFAIGFFGVAYYKENADKLRAVLVVNPKDSVAYGPTTENIATNKYAPFSRPLFIYVNTESLARAEVQTFVEYFLANVSSICEPVGYVQLPAELIGKAEENLISETIGTHFMSSDGEGRSGSLVDLFKPGNLTTKLQ
ncbi:MAG: PstS family phosphate ABC transporter substrate-binding protein [Planctomycetota bacterium]